ncbi:MAG: methylaspartate mutase accessory protein GlmL [Oscillospiraceae bacterium]|nr:methylaspartate mutase accessory protein GlmL [Oscillospiraceae bacterium]
MSAKAALLIDFGSTFTKVSAAGLQSGEIIGTAAAYTTVETDVGYGLATALAELRRQTGNINFATRLACSSAAGGLRMIASGLVPALTAEAAKVAALGAGAKVVKVYSYELTGEDVDEIAEARPDIFLLTGGTDGGNRECVLHNAEMLAGCKAEFPILIAGNRSCAAQCEKLLAGREVYRCENVLPALGKLNVEPAGQRIRELFLRKIIYAKGLSREAELLSGIMMPTPAAVLCGVELLAKGTDRQPGLGELVAVDLGGATTDVYSMAEGAPTRENTVIKGLPEPWAKRTVEGDIGMRYTAAGVLDAVGSQRLAKLSGLEQDAVEELVRQIERNPATLPDTPQQSALDFALASAAVEVATARHAGIIEEHYTPTGQVWLQTGKDLTRVKTLIAIGGALIRGKDAAKIAAHALHDPAAPQSLRPKSAQILVDRRYILSAAGLLAGEHPEEALAIMKKEIVGDAHPGVPAIYIHPPI